MALPRPAWKGYLKFSLVTCPVAMMPALDQSGKIRFHTLNRKTGNRVRSQYIDAGTGAPVDDDLQVLGYQRGEHDYVEIEEDELASVALESAHTIDIETFVPKDSIEWIWYDSPYFLVPNDPVGEEAFSVIREAMRATATVGISRLVLYRREHAIMLEPRDRGIVLWTLRYGTEVRDPAPYFAEMKSAAVDAQLLSLISTLIDENLKPWSRRMASDPVQEHLQDIIAAKRKGGKPLHGKAAAPPSNVVNIMDALKKSIAREEKAANKPKAPRNK